DETLCGGATAAPVPDPEQLLAHDALEVVGQRVPHLRLAVRGQRIDDAVDGLGRSARMQRAEDEVAGLRRLEGERDRLRGARPHPPEDAWGAAAEGPPR